MSETAALGRIDPERYRHPDDRQALGRLEKIPGFAKGMATLAEILGGQAERRGDIASMIRVGTGVYPRLHDLWNATQKRFGLGNTPLHLAFRPDQPWSFQGGGEARILVLDQDWLETLPPAEMAALLAMRAGDIRLGNAGRLAATDALRRIQDFSGLAALPAAMLFWGLENWRRAAMFSSDRAAALSFGEAGPVADLLLRLAGAGGRAWGGIADPDAPRLQGLEAVSLERDWGNSLLRRFALAMNRQNNGALIRRLDILSWFAAGTPARILSGDPPEAETEAAAAEDDATGWEGSKPAFWGAFVGLPDDPREGRTDADPGQPNLAEAVEKGWSALREAGEALWRSLDPSAKSGSSAKEGRPNRHEDWP
jgi:hypothetical protein